VRGLLNAAQHAEQRIQILATDPNRKQDVRHFETVLSQIMNNIRAYAQRVAEQKQKSAQGGNGGIDPVTQSKILGNIIMAKSKAEQGAKSHAQKTSQRQISFEQKIKQQQEQHAADIGAKDLQAASEINRNRLRSLE
jgi:hypothetical protein